MRIGIDVRTLQSVHGMHGTGKYTLRLIEGVSRLAPNFEFLLAVMPDKPVMNELKNLPKNCRLVPVPTTQIDDYPFYHQSRLYHRLPRIWRKYYQLRQRQNQKTMEQFAEEQCLDVLHFPTVVSEQYFPDANASCRVIKGILDVIPLELDEIFFSRWGREAKLIYYLQLQSLKRADKVIAISESARQDTIKHVGLDPDKIQTIHCGVFQGFAQKQAPDIVAVSNRYLNVGLNYFLYCSGFGPNKNWQRVMEAFSEFNRTRKERYQLVFAGIHDPTDLEQLKRLTYDLGLSKETFVLPGYVSDLRLARLFAGATALVTPSLYEGFGLPAVQAMQAGIPVIASNRSSHPEVVQDAGILVTPENTEEIAEAMRTLADDPILRRRLGERGIQSAQRFSVENQARAVLEVYTGKPWRHSEADHTTAVVTERRPVSLPRETLSGSRRPKIHWFCPVPPAKTAIAHYSMGVLRAMQKTADVTVWVSQEEWSPEVEEVATVKMFHPEMLTHDEMAADAIFYHIGNNIEFHKAIWEASQRFPGTTILHDINVMGFFESYYLVGARSPEPFARILKQYYGTEGVTALQAYTRGEFDSKELVRRFPLTEHAYRGATGVITHTPAAEAAVREQSRVPVLLAPLPYADIGQADDYVAHREVQPGEPYRLVIFGHISFNRRVEEILKALATLGERAVRIRLDIYGAVVEEQNLRERIAALGLQERVTLHGFVSEAKLNQALADAHLALNLRYPTMGESSYSQLQLWDHALPALVTKTGYYATLPQETVAFVHPETEEADIQKHLLAFLENPSEFAEMGRRGHEHLLAQHRPEQYADAILSFVLSGVKA